MKAFRSLLPDERARRAVQVIAVLLIPLVLFDGLTTLQVLRNQSWPYWTAVGVSYAYTTLCLGAAGLCFRRRVDLAIWLVMTGAVIVLGLAALRNGLGLVYALTAFVVVSAISNQALPSRQSGWALMLAVTGAILIYLADVFGPVTRPTAGNSWVTVVVMGALVLVYGVLLVRQFPTFNFRTKIVIGPVLITAVVGLGMGYFMYTRINQIQNLLTGRLDTAVTGQATQKLEDLVQVETQAANTRLADIAETVTTLARYRAALAGQAAALQADTYWNAQQKLTTLAGGQWGNPATDLAAVFVPATVPLEPDLIADLNLSARLDFVAPSLLRAHSEVVAVYFINTAGATTYYPNISLAGLVAPDFDPRTQAFYTLAAPDQNPSGRLVWTPPYQDPAGKGLIVTAAMPVIDSAGRFQGVMAADVQLVRITDEIASLQIGVAGLGFVVDAAGRLIVMPPTGLTLFGLPPETVATGATPQTTVFTSGQPEFVRLAHRMTAGEAGLERLTLEREPYYLAFAPLPAVGYSMGVVVQVAELNAPYVTVFQQVDAESRTTLRYASLIVIGLLVAGALASLGIGQLLIQPLLRLTQTARQISLGDLGAQAEVNSADEIGALATTFNAMTAQLRTLIGNLEQRVADRTRALTASAEVSRRLSTILDQRQLVVEVVEQVKAAFNYYHAHIYLFDETRNSLVMVGGTGEAGRIMLERGHKLPRGRGLVGRAAETGKEVLVPDTAQDAGWLPNPLLPETRSEAAIPIAIGGRVIGVLDVQQNTAGALTEEDVRLLQSVANQVAVALENARSYTQAQRQAEIEALLNSISQKIQNAPTPEAVLQVTAQELGRALGARRAVAQVNLSQLDNNRS